MQKVTLGSQGAVVYTNEREPDALGNQRQAGSGYEETLATRVIGSRCFRGATSSFPCYRRIASSPQANEDFRNNPDLARVELAGGSSNSTLGSVGVSSRWLAEQRQDLLQTLH